MGDNDEKAKVSKEFAEHVVQWVKIDDALREIRNKSKELTTEKKEHESFILEYLEKINEKAISISDGNIRRNISKTKVPLKKETIYESLKDITKDAGKAQQMTEHIINNRPEQQRVNLKRTKLRGEKTGKEKEV